MRRNDFLGRFEVFWKRSKAVDREGTSTAWSMTSCEDHGRQGARRVLVHTRCDCHEYRRTLSDARREDREQTHRWLELGLREFKDGFWFLACELIAESKQAVVCTSFFATANKRWQRPAFTSLLTFHALALPSSSKMSSSVLYTFISFTFTLSLMYLPSLPVPWPLHAIRTSTSPPGTLSGGVPTVPTPRPRATPPRSNWLPTRPHVLTRLPSLTFCSVGLKDGHGAFCLVEKLRFRFAQRYGS